MNWSGGNEMANVEVIAERREHARLFKAAPEMLAALRVFVKHVPCSRTLHMDGQPTVKGCPGCDVRTLLTKIDGGTK
jgi:hypothetical protein